MTTHHTPHPGPLAELHARIHALEAWRTHQTDLLDELLNNHHHTDHDDNADGDDGDGDGDGDGDPAGSAPLDGDELITWVHRSVTPVIARPLRGEIKWCPLWWEHPEAVFRFAALHRAWTELAAEPGTAMSVWIRDHLDPCLRELFHPHGPFADCGHNPRTRALNPEHRPLPTLPTAAPPDHR